MNHKAQRPDIGFVLWIDAFSLKVVGGYEAHVFDGIVKKIGATLTPPAALAHMTSHIDIPVSVLHV